MWMHVERGILRDFCWRICTLILDNNFQSSLMIVGLLERQRRMSRLVIGAHGFASCALSVDLPGSYGLVYKSCYVLLSFMGCCALCPPPTHRHPPPTAHLPPRPQSISLTLTSCKLRHHSPIPSRPHGVVDSVNLGEKSPPRNDPWRWRITFGV